MAPSPRLISLEDLRSARTPEGLRRLFARLGYAVEPELVALPDDALGLAPADAVTVRAAALVVDTVHPTRHDLDVIEGLAVGRRDPDALYESHVTNAFNLEAVTKRFYQEYAEHFRRVDAALAQHNRGVRAFYDDAERHAFAQLFLGHLMFLYFIQKKGWLAEDRRFLMTQYQCGGGAADDAGDRGRIEHGAWGQGTSNGRRGGDIAGAMWRRGEERGEPVSHASGRCTEFLARAWMAAMPKQGRGMVWQRGGRWAGLAPINERQCSLNGKRGSVIEGAMRPCAILHVPKSRHVLYTKGGSSWQSHQP